MLESRQLLRSVISLQRSRVCFLSRQSWKRAGDGRASRAVVLGAEKLESSSRRGGGVQQEREPSTTLGRSGSLTWREQGSEQGYAQ
jgi:hypothetical protein